MTDEELDLLAITYVTDNKITDLIDYIRTIQQRNLNLSKAHRIAENSAAQYLMPLTALRKIDRDFRNGDLDQIQFNAGVHLFATDS
jgi:hypothetical protein